MADDYVSDTWRSGNRNGVTHGHTIGKNIPPEYNTWKGMRHRCTNPNHRVYALYGGRGITVCERWAASFQAFLDDVGRKPSPDHSLDRIDVDGNYEPGNVRWATQQDQCRNQRRNRRLMYQGQERTLAEICQMAGVEASHMNYHLQQGRSADEAAAIILAKRTKPRGVCVNGHALEGDNRYVSPKGGVQCRACRSAARERSRAKGKAA